VAAQSGKALDEGGTGTTDHRGKGERDLRFELAGIQDDSAQRHKLVRIKGPSQNCEN
jgi:hypothetical protein